MEVMEKHPAGLDGLEEAIRSVGLANLASELGIDYQQIQGWRRPGRKFATPAEHCSEVERISGVRRWRLRPDDWARIWPELIGAEGAPPVPADVREVA